MTYAYRQRGKDIDMNLGFKLAFLNDDVFVSFLQGGVLFLQLLVLPASPSVLKPNSDLTRVKTKL